MVPASLSVFLNQNKVTILIWAVSAMKFVIQARCFQREVPQFVDKVLFSGEVLPVKILNEWKRSVPSALFVNLYAPSEVTGNCLYQIIDSPMKEGEKISLGKEFPNVEVLILNDEFQKIREGEMGEIYVRGAYLSSGYYGNMEETRKVFIQNPLQKNIPEIMYKTGDLAKLRNGKLYYHSRVDDQIKHMGHRIELGEIECVGNEIPKVTKSCAFLSQKKNKIILAVEGENLERKEVLCFLKGRLPKYMVPHEVIVMKELAVTDHGKVDKKRIRMLYEKGEIGYV